MLKKAGAAAAIAAGLMLIGSPAFAGEPEHHDGWGHDHHGSDAHQWNSDGLVSALNNNNVNVPVGVCNNNVGVLAIVAPIASPQAAQNCSGAVIVDGNDGNVGGNSAG
ncbi:hypothetical protein AB0I60_26045 [Actinosynnema sp. NPDC050436]|uniref:hypothetical protein n=1 Tax=Actinosynnema sp. NPDC050436 TaxID=3155659 RepID=UPI0033D38A6B